MPREHTDYAENSMADRPLGYPILTTLYWETPLTWGMLIAVFVLWGVVLLGIILWMAGVFNSITVLVLFAIAGLASGLRVATYFTMRGSVEVCEHGLIVRDSFGGETDLPYAEVEDIVTPEKLPWLGMDVLKSTRLLMRDGFEFSFSKLEPESLEVFKPVVLEKVAVPLGNQMLQQINQGGAVDLEGVVVGPQGIQADRGGIGWQQLDYATFRKDGCYLFVKNQAKPQLILPLDTPRIYPLLYVISAVKNSVNRNDPAESNAATRPDSFAFLTDQAAEATAAIQSTLKKGRRKGASVPGYPDEDPDLGTVHVGVGPNYLIIAISAVAFLFFGIVSPILILLEVFPAWAWIPAILGGLAGLANMTDIERRGFAVYDRGIRQGKTIVRWSECSRLFMSITDFYIEGVTFSSRQSKMGIDGPNAVIRFHLGGLESSETCYRALNAALPMLVERYHGIITKWGDGVTAGPLTLTRDAVIDGLEVYPLRRIRKAQLASGHFTFHVKRKGDADKEVQIKADAWNFPIFYALFRTLWKDANQKPSP